MSECETYLGDGLYASFDGYQIKLRAPRENGDHEIYLEPSVLDALREYTSAVYQTRALEILSHPREAESAAAAEPTQPPTQQTTAADTDSDDPHGSYK